MFRIDDINIDVERQCLMRAGEETHLRRKSFQVLAYLVKHRDRLVSKEEMFASIWPETAVTDDVLVQCIRDIRRAMGDDPHSPRFIKTVPRAGYRFIGPVEERQSESGFTEEITRVEFEIEEDIDAGRFALVRTGLRPRRFFSVRLVAAAAAFAALLIVVMVAYFGLGPNTSTAEVRLPRIEGREAVAVMFFENASGDKDLDWLREGLADMLITNLSRSERLTVLSRQQLALLLERTGRDPARSPLTFEASREIAARSGAETLISGSFIRLGERMRINVQIYDAASGSLRASESLTAEKLDDLLAQIDLLSIRVARHLRGDEPAPEGGFAIAMTDNIEAYRLYSLGVAKAKSFQANEAIDALKKAVEIDPEFAMAHARLGYTYAIIKAEPDEGKPHLEVAFKMSSRLTPNDRAHIAAWYEIANRNYPAAITAYREIVKREPLDPESYWRLARLLAGENRTDEAIDVTRQGLAVDPEAKNLYNTLGSLLSSLGKHGEAIAAHQRYVELAPEEPNAYDSLGLTYQWAGESDRAMESFARAFAIDPRFEIALIHMAFCQIRRGEYRAAIKTTNKYLEMAETPGERGRGLDILSYIHLGLGDLRAAETAAQQHLKLVPNGSRLVAYMIAMKKDDLTLARTFASSAVAINSLAERGSRINPRFDLYIKGLSALDSGRAEEALDLFRGVLEHRPPTYFEDFEDCLGRAYLTLGRHDEAIAELERVLNLSPNYPRARFYLARAYRAKGISDDARNNYQKFLSEWKNADADLPEIVEARSY